MSELKITIGGSPAADGAAFVAAWHRIAAGDTSIENTLSFQSWEALAAVMTKERLRLLRHVHLHPAPSIVALAKALGRQYRRVHEDVALLESNGLLRRDGGEIKATVDRITAMIELA